MTRTATFSKLLTSLVLSLLVVACGGQTAPERPSTVAPADRDTEQTASTQDDEQPPTGRLSRDVQPQDYTLALQIVPKEERFSGSARINVDLKERRERIWLHGRDLNVSEVTVTPEGGEALAGEWEQVNDEGLVSLRLPEAVGPGEATIAVTYSAAFGRQLRGLYRVEEDGEAYAFTQFEALSARSAFPSFDEPSFKTSFDVTLIVQEDDVAAGNTPIAEQEQLEDGLKRLRFEPTKPMPTYLVAWAVGPLDVVEAEDVASNDWRERELPFRGLAVKGKGDKLQYALENTPALLEKLEAYFGDEYPYRKLDIVAVPDFAAGAMENVGLVTFRETLLLLGEDPPEWQKRAFANVMAHELAHMWFGNVVTMPWWNDLWLNEAFATWMAYKVVADVHPEYEAPLQKLETVQGAMKQDSLTSARQIRQPIESSHDIRNAFDSITYRKGGGVLEMFERWLGEDTFRKGIRRYIRENAWSNATAEDLLAALGRASGKDVAEPFDTFLTQPGLPFVKVEPTCEEGSASLDVSQSRFFPVGSTGDTDRSWKFPMCIRYESGGEVRDSCELLQEQQQTIELAGDGCPAWVMPNADGAGYFRFSLPAEWLDKLREAGWKKLADREKLAVADSVQAAFQNASLPASDVYGGLGRYARSDIRPVASIPMDLVGFAKDYLVEEERRDAVAEFGRKLYRPVFQKLGWKPKRNETGETKLRRAEVIGFMALGVEDPRVRRRAEKLGQRYVGYKRNGKIDDGAVASDLVDTVLAVAVQEGQADFFDAVMEHLLDADDALLRGRLLKALAKSKDPELAERARQLSLDERLRVNEVMTPLRTQMNMRETRDATWSWMKDSYDALVERLSPHIAAYMPWFASSFCSEEKASQVEGFFEDKIEELPGGPRNLQGALEAIRLCAARVEAHRESARELF